MVTVTEEDKLLAAAAPHLRSIIIAALDSGMRRGEILTQRLGARRFHPEDSVRHATRKQRAARVARFRLPSGYLQTSKPVGNSPQGIVFTFDKQPISRIKTAWKGALRRAGVAFLSLS